MPLSAVRRSLATAGTAALVLATSCAAAEAHVRVTPDTATPGSYVTLTFKVPTESATASTTKLEVDLPTDHPFGSVSYQPVTGWTTTVTTSKLATPVKTDDGEITEAPTKLVWIASADAAIKPGQFQTFAISVGPVPDTGKLELPAHQTYSDGSVVNWNQAPTGSQEPEHPAPVLYVNDTPPDPQPTINKPTVSASQVAEQATSDNTARWFGVGGIVLGAAGLVAAVWALTRRPRG
ncbi:uncharacterized protein YcnI [Branchiibius hedensis]|uniref:Uncharacterized protein YcnI n=1 Tax=Branchiibius hedensis TaxID=672460 RepID=A0A2Y9A018_9MICO|nr:YcnI family protein [Branchiibius hedensis]PWJ26706.1 uncharacterized protein YcnI [Branchiibius hedensis]SSA35517.1 Uncharacterized protein YcnI [Branchiibius hedensis]